MDSTIRISQVQNVSQQLNLAPQLLQWLKLLQVSTVELSQMVQHELEINPVLELDTSRLPEEPVSISDDADSRNTSNLNDELPPTSFDHDDVSRRVDALHEIDNEWNDDFHPVELATPARSKEGQDLHQYVMESIVAPTPLFEHLEHQLVVAHLNAEDCRIARMIIGSLDRRGYLDSSLGDIAEQAQTTTDRVEKVLSIVHQMDPPGIAARDLHDCLSRQIDRKKDPIAFTIVKDFFDLLVCRNLNGIADAMQIDLSSVQEALVTIGQLNPTPGLELERNATEYVTPDVVVHKKDGRHVVELNDELVPALRVTDDSRKMLAGAASLPAEDLAYLRRKMRSASFLIQGIAQRQATLYKVACEIVRAQQDFFDGDNVEMGCLTMGRVARVIGVHETTVSRAISGKYVKTSKGILPMRAFFESGYSCADGSALTPGQVKKVIAEIVAHEAPEKRRTDIGISSLLEERGLKVARRTVAKYREELFIPSSKDRALLNTVQ